jgi:membrane protease subunit (stomatin/prohibitin family)
MDAQLIASTPDDHDALYAWWDGDTLQENAQLTVQPDELAVFVDGDVVVQEMGPGAHTLTGAANPELKIYFARKVGHSKTIEVCFVKTREWPFEYHGAVDEDVPEGASFNATAVLLLQSATQLVEAMLEVEATAYDENGNSTLAEDEEAPTIDDWVADQLYAETAACVKEKATAQQQIPRLTKAVSDAGLKVVRVELELHGAGARPEGAPIPANGASATGATSFCGQCGAKQEGAGKFCGQCGEPRS